MMKKFVGNYEYDYEGFTVCYVVGIIAPDADEAREILIDYLHSRYDEVLGASVTGIRQDDLFFDACPGLTILRTY